jgi:hypothetical protein
MIDPASQPQNKASDPTRQNKLRFIGFNDRTTHTPMQLTAAARV